MDALNAKQCKISPGPASATCPPFHSNAFAPGRRPAVLVLGGGIRQKKFENSLFILINPHVAACALNATQSDSVPQAGLCQVLHLIGMHAHQAGDLEAGIF
jgi:hypothetical protein